MKSAEAVETFLDLSHKEDYQNWQKNRPTEDGNEILEFLQTGRKPNLHFQQLPVFFQNSCYFIYKNNCFYYFAINIYLISLQDGFGKDKSYKAFMKNATENRQNIQNIPSAVIVKTETKLKGFKHIAIINADESLEANLVDFGQYGLPIVIFDCVKQMLGNDLDFETIKIWDFSVDQRKELTYKQMEALKSHQFIYAKAKLKPPEKGFSLIEIGNKFYWHRSGTLLISQPPTKTRYLFGQDEGTYFGVQLASIVSSIPDAYDDLIPEYIRNRKDITRQGEWFGVPVAEKDVPSFENCTLMGDSNTYGTFLQVLSDDDHHHNVDFTEMRVAQTGIVYFKNPRVEHDEHLTLELKGWHTFVRNTAVRSVSQEGVD